MEESYRKGVANHPGLESCEHRREAVGEVGVGRNPFALLLSRDGRKAYVANMGTFQYSLIETREPQDDPRGVAFPPAGYPSQEARDGTVVEGRRVMQQYNCVGCHEIEKRGGFIRKYYQENLALAPPVLNGEGEKVQSQWFFSFLKAPSNSAPSAPSTAR